MLVYSLLAWLQNSITIPFIWQIDYICFLKKSCSCSVYWLKLSYYKGEVVFVFNEFVFASIAEAVEVVTEERERPE